MCPPTRSTDRRVRDGGPESIPTVGCGGGSKILLFYKNEGVRCTLYEVHGERKQARESCLTHITVQ